MWMVGSVTLYKINLPTSSELITSNYNKPLKTESPLETESVHLGIGSNNWAFQQVSPASWQIIMVG